MDYEYYSSYMEVDLGQLRSNIAGIQAGCRKKVIPVIKGNGYGLGLVPVAKTLIEKSGYDTLAVAQLIEAKQIREAGFNDVTLMVLSGIPLHAIPYAVKLRALLMIYTKEMADILSKAVKDEGLESFPIQIKIDTGLHRIGVAPEKMMELVDYIRSKGNLEIVGIVSHYANSYDREDPLTEIQYERFVKCVEEIRKAGIEPKYIHIGCSPNIEWPNEDICTHVRVGWGFIIYTPYEGFFDYYGCKPVSSVRSFITDIHELKAGEQVGYGGDCRLEADRKTATISIGTCDGVYKPMITNGGYALIHGKKAKYMELCMDQLFIDVTGIDCKIGDEVTLLGKDKYSDERITLTIAGDNCDGAYSINRLYFNDRVKRIYVNE